jgi:hypothetical protein
MIILFACRPNRLRDIGLLRLGASEAGHRFQVMLLPFMAPLVVLAALLRLLGMKIYLVISDQFPGDQLLARLFGRSCTRMLWNYADEWPVASTRLPEHQVCFFPQPGFPTDLFRFAPQPQPRLHTISKPIVFLGDVSVDFRLPRGVDWWRDQFGRLRDAHGYGFYLKPEYEQLICDALESAADRRTARVLAKNLLRLWIVQSASAAFGDRLVLVGSNWRRFSLNAEKSLYNEAGRLAYFGSAAVNLDCGSKSGDICLYPRSSELISYAGGLLQVCCQDSAQVYGERAEDFSYCDEASLLARLDARLRESPEARRERDAWLVSRLEGQKLLMQHSMNRMLDRSRC